MVNELLEDIFYMQLGTGSKKKTKKNNIALNTIKCLKIWKGRMQTLILQKEKVWLPVATPPF